jgi:hypothetical protein
MKTFLNCLDSVSPSLISFSLLSLLPNLIDNMGTPSMIMICFEQTLRHSSAQHNQHLMNKQRTYILRATYVFLPYFIRIIRMMENIIMISLSLYSSGTSHHISSHLIDYLLATGSGAPHSLHWITHLPASC